MGVYLDIWCEPLKKAGKSIKVKVPEPHLHYSRSRKCQVISDRSNFKTLSTCTSVLLSSQEVSVCTLSCWQCVFLWATALELTVLWGGFSLSHRTAAWLCTWFNVQDSTASNSHFFCKCEPKKTDVWTVHLCIIRNFQSYTTDVVIFLNFCFVFTQSLCLYILHRILCLTLNSINIITFKLFFLFWSQQYLLTHLSLILESNI